jgi:hypothetical protein
VFGVAPTAVAVGCRPKGPKRVAFGTGRFGMRSPGYYLAEWQDADGVSRTVARFASNFVFYY